MAYRQEKTTELIRHLASEFIERESGGNGLITITHVSVSDDYKEAMILFTVYPEKEEKAALDFLKRRRTDFKHYVKQKSRIGRVPFFDFELDYGEKNRQKIDAISNNL
ncbi:MAG TPA: ribosome-binding factor A [Candidatus Paceibacterota bacterium]|nr:ribosome-binding factor A [Candidatus Paceibacterota bacterium]